MRVCIYKHQVGIRYVKYKSQWVTNEWDGKTVLLEKRFSNVTGKEH